MDDNCNITAFILHPAINQSWLAEQLWGSREGKYRTRLSKSLSGVRNWKPEEIERIHQIREKLKEDLK
jgi:hypothetical protein